MRYFWFSIGAISLCLALIGIPLPLLPTVPFLLLSAFAFARSSEQLHNWLINHPKLGPSIAHWEKSGAIGPRAKKYATLSIFASFALAYAFGAPTNALIIQSVVLLAVMVFIWTRPSA
ncbi:MAG: YbaN family protein [Halocynthiibacter sp.]